MARLKVERAGHLINEVEAEIERFRKDPQLHAKMFTTEDGGFTAEVISTIGPLKVGPIIGDTVHNLRSALDVMASELARLNGMSARDVYFPIADSADQLDGKIKKKCFHKAGDDAVELLKQFSPYRGGNVALRGLHELNIQDKHTLLAPTDFMFQTRISVPIEDGALQVAKGQINYDPDSVKLVFPDNTAFSGDEVVPTLKNLVELVHSIVEAFSALVAARGPS